MPTLCYSQVVHIQGEISTQNCFSNYKQEFVIGIFNIILLSSYILILRPSVLKGHLKRLPEKVGGTEQKWL